MLAHAGTPVAPHDVWRAWNLDPVLVSGLLLSVWAYGRGRAVPHEPVSPWRQRCFVAALAALAVALVSPLDALSGALASAHMVQHVLLMLVAAPLLAVSAPLAVLLRGSPAVVREATGRWRLALEPGGGGSRAWCHPVVVWLLHVGALWFWHASVPYSAALENHVIHVVEHASFLVSGVLFWRVVIGPLGGDRVSNGYGVLLIFTMALQSVFLSALLTFARAPWYPPYAATTAPWGLDPLADQQLAGVVMWIPAGLVYVCTALALLATWIKASEREELAL